VNRLLSPERPKTNIRSKRPLSLRERAGVREALAVNFPVEKAAPFSTLRSAIYSDRGHGPLLQVFTYP